jgi:lipopolysaccharide/colanic/teichoic acid biosynthesis glycosyltransferase
MSFERAVPISGARRSLDLAVAGPAIVVLAPVLATIAVAIRLGSRGPALFRQTRIGAGGMPFVLVKFRTMRSGVTGSEITEPGDARVTRLGTFLRSTSLDELPQLFNVLRGDMTLVGPRPETPALAARYPQGCDSVFRYRPGMTGPAQIRLRDADVLPRGQDVETYYLTTVVPLRVRLDFEFLATPTLWNTLEVLWDTARYLMGSRTPPPMQPHASATERNDH